MVSSEYWFGAEAGFFNNVATQSLRFDDGSSAYLARTASGGNRRTWTFSTWLKRANFTGAEQHIFQGGTYSGSGGTQQLRIKFNADEKFNVTEFNGSATTLNLITDAVFRDTSAWYHIVVAFDTTQGTDSDRVKIYINGTLQTLGTATYPSQNLETYVNQDTKPQELGRRNGIGAYLDGYLAESIMVDGTQLAPTSFGETKNGVWIAKEYTGSYGTNGFRLDFKGTGTATSSGAVSSPTNIGDDSSGQNNHFAVSGFTTTDSNLNDSPENNHATLNPLQAVVNDTSTKPTLSEGNLVMSTSTADYQGFSSTIPIPTEGKYAFKVKMNTESSTQTHRFGVGTSISGNGICTGNAGNASQWHNAYVFAATAPRFDKNINGTGQVNGSNLSPATVAGDEIEFLVDMDNGTIDTKLNGSAYGTQLTGMPTDKPLFPFGTVYESGSGTSTLTFTFDYTPSDSNYLTICTANLPEPTISPNANTQAVDHFGILTYTSDGNGVSIVSGGNDNNGTAIGGEISFQPDWVWIKRRNGSAGHMLQDSSRGSTKRLRSDNTDQEITTSTAVTSFDNNGFTLGTESGVNTNTGTYVAWNWLANGTTPTKTYKVKVVADSTDYGHGTGSNKYQFFKSDGSTGYGTNGVDLDLQEGGTYTFDWSDSSAQSHPIRFSLTNDGTHSSGTSAGTEYTTGVVKDDSAYTTTITVASGVANLYYYCQNHSGMGAEINTNTTHGSTNFDGSILSVSNANTLAGFSIVTYTGTDSNATVGHGLSTAPDVVLVKGRSNDSRFWTYWGTQFVNTSYIYLNTSGAVDTGGATITNSTYPSSTFFSIGTSVFVNGSSETYVAYCFHSVEGYSKIGSFTGNGDVDGTFVYLGFRPSFILYKSTGSGNWLIDDDVTQAFNPDSNYLVADTSDQEGDTGTNTAGHVFDMLSNGFKMRNTNSARNADGGTFIYIAFARQAFKFANAR